MAHDTPPDPDAEHWTALEGRALAAGRVILPAPPDIGERVASALERLIQLTELSMGLTATTDLQREALDYWLGSLDLEQLEEDALAGAGLSANTTGLIVDQIRLYLQAPPPDPDAG